MRGFFWVLCVVSMAWGKYSIAVMDIDGFSSVNETRTFSEKLRGEIIRVGEYEVVERNALDVVFQEQGLEQCFESDCVIRAGQSMGVSYMILGSVGRVETFYVLSLRQIDVADGKIVRSVEEVVSGGLSDLFRYGIPNVVRKITSGSVVVDTGSRVFLSSNPPRAHVYVDGRLVGLTNMGWLSVPAGEHSVMFVGVDKVLVTAMTFCSGVSVARHVVLVEEKPKFLAQYSER